MNLEFIDISASGRQITLRAVGDLPVGVVQSTVFIKRAFEGNKKDGKITFDTTSIPNFVQVTDGLPFTLNSLLLDVSLTENKLLKFRDGVLEVEYHESEVPIGGTGTIGTDYIIIDNPPFIPADYDSIVAERIPYTIRKATPTNGGTVLYLTENLKESITEFRPSYKSVLRLKVDIISKTAIIRSVEVIRSKNKRISNELRDAVSKMAHNNLASTMLFSLERYEDCDMLLRENVDIAHLYNLYC